MYYSFPEQTNTEELNIQTDQERWQNAHHHHEAEHHHHEADHHHHHEADHHHMGYEVEMPYMMKPMHICPCVNMCSMVCCISPMMECQMPMCHEMKSDMKCSSDNDMMSRQGPRPYYPRPYHQRPYYPYFPYYPRPYPYTDTDYDEY